MWPWGHAAFGYVLVSLGSRLTRGRPPSGAAVFALLVATQLPDLVDKPLSWVFHLFPQGVSVAHSVFVAVPLGLLAVAAAAQLRRLEVGVAFTVGWWSHLLGDVATALLYGYGTEFALMRVLWPVATFPPYDDQQVALERVLEYLGEFLTALSTTQQVGLLAVYFGPFFVAFVLWLVDGAPGVRKLRELADI
ncbi:LexA-binding, inner membrane-associated putative hydrolase [Halogranum amylolyticum]|uniref:LexA-binding, inner membrane-associated putative hydrolase n=1 Tax=Halogranum amylolyticum TaxID=660520 RepID=A0A1H8W4H2_9EURY|nr:metal-dependent hydrolase [Halogranum amylolyticum]SEP22529.1 LexA-binding, inner membrane-associated putative hydrolase [Halogranum amylolyticum]